MTNYNGFPVGIVLIAPKNCLCFSLTFILEYWIPPILQMFHLRERNIALMLIGNFSLKNILDFVIIIFPALVPKETCIFMDES